MPEHVKACLHRATLEAYAAGADGPADARVEGDRLLATGDVPCICST